MNIAVSDIIDRIDDLLRERGETRRALVAAGAVDSVQNITAWSKRGTIPRADNALAIADYLGVSVRWLLTGKDKKVLSRDEYNALVKYQYLTDDNRRVIQATMDAMLSVPEEGKKQGPA
jgi:transcriptional regulator with XRE-family HTH domain